MAMLERWFVGECMVELREAGGGMLEQSFSGDVYNTAVYFNRMAGSSDNYFISGVGTDMVSAALLDQVAAHELKKDYIVRVTDRHPGLYWIKTDEYGERTFLYWRNDSAARMMLDLHHFSQLKAKADNCELIYFSGITLAILDDARKKRLLQLAESVRKNGGWVCFDSNYRPYLWRDPKAAAQWMNAALEYATHALVTFDDESKLHHDKDAGATMKRLLAAGAIEAVVKLGAEGCLVQSSSMPKPTAIPTKKVKPVDTTAAGDSFNAAYLAKRINGEGIENAAQAGSQLAARVIRFTGAIIDQSLLEQQS